MTKQEIQDVLQKPDYDSLLKVYNAYKIHSKHDQFFGAAKDKAPGTLAYNLLLRKVQDIYRKLSANNSFDDAKPASIPAPKKAIDTGKIKLPPDNTKVRIIKPNPMVKYEDLPDELQAVYNEIGQINSEMKSFHARMKVAEDDKTRKQCLDKLCDLEEKGQDNWKKIDDWWNANQGEKKNDSTISASGKRNDPAAMTPDQIAKKIDQCKRYLSRYSSSKDLKQQAKCTECWETLQFLRVEWKVPAKKATPNKGK